jgi:hypothetical protein
MAGFKDFKDRVKFSLTARRVIDRGSGGELAGPPGDEKRSRRDDTEILVALGAAGRRLRRLPPPPDTLDRKRALMQKVDAARPAGVAEVKPARDARRMRTMRALAVAGVAVLIVLVLFVAVGFGSVNAMPGSPLYSVKRFTESVKLGFTSGGVARANAYIQQADKRVQELEYASQNNMSGWYYGLSRDALAALDNSRQQLATVADAQRVPLLARAQSVASSFASRVQQVLPSMGAEQQRRIAEQKQKLERRLPQLQPHPGQLPPVQNRQHSAPQPPPQNQNGSAPAPPPQNQPGGSQPAPPNQSSAPAQQPPAKQPPAQQQPPQNQGNQGQPPR